MDKENLFGKIKSAGESAASRAKELKPTRVKINSYFERLQENGKALVVTVIAAFVVMIFCCLAVFFIHVKGAEEVMVPDVTGKELMEALLEMQKKELYPKITPRYSEVPGDKGTVLDQSPSAGSIVKGYSRVSLVVSRGVVIDAVGNYIGQNLDELKMNLQTLFAGTTQPLIILDEPEYKPDLAEVGTILEQDPPEGTEILEPVHVRLVVSRGPSYENTRVPRLVGSSVNDVLQTIARSRIVFDFTSHTAQDGETPGTVVSQQQFDSEFIPNYARMSVEFALPRGEYAENVYGIFSAELTEYPYPVAMRLEATTSDGSSYTLVNFLHTGGSLTLPYAVPKETVLTLYVVDKAQKKITVH